VYISDATVDEGPRKRRRTDGYGPSDLPGYPPYPPFGGPPFSDGPSSKC